MTADELAEAQRTYRAAQTIIRSEMDRAARDRDDVIRAAVAGGMSYRAVAAATGLSHSRVMQIVVGK